MSIGIQQLVLRVFIIGLLSASSYADKAKVDITPKSICNNDSLKNQVLNEHFYIEIGGIKQWVTINGADCSNPVVLMVHGGPGNPLSLYHKSLYASWENDFTVVHWDQRGSGRTYEANQKPGELTLEQLQNTKLDLDLLVSDGVKITDFIRRVLNKDKLILSGTSWGSVLAVNMAIKAPESYSFYLGVSQLVNYEKNMKQSYQLVRTKAIKKQDTQAIETLNAIGPPPWKSPRSFGQLRRIIRTYENQIVSPLPELVIAKDYTSKNTKAAYFAGEEFSFVKFVGLNGDGMAQSIALDNCCTLFEIPIYLLQGKNDLLTTPEITKDFYTKIKAPSKHYILNENSGHDPNISMLNRQFNLLKLGMKDYVKSLDKTH